MATMATRRTRWEIPLMGMMGTVPMGWVIPSMETTVFQHMGWETQYMAMTDSAPTGWGIRSMVAGQTKGHGGAELSGSWLDR